MKPQHIFSPKSDIEPEIKVNSKTPTIKLKNIIRIEGLSNYSLIHTKRGTLICTKSLKFFVENIEDTRFIRTHKSHIVNVDYVKKFNSCEGNSTLNLTNGSVIEVARRRTKDTLEKLNSRF